VGYDVEYLLFQMSRELGLTSDWPVVIVGLGNLGHALANYGGFHERGFPIAALVDTSEHVVGTQINGVTVRHIDDLPQIAAEHGIAIGIIATPAHAAQEVADRLIEAGVSSVLNFAPTILSVPDEVSLRKVDLAVELQILSFYQRRKGGDGQRRSSIDAGPADPTGPTGPNDPAEPADPADPAGRAAARGRAKATGAGAGGNGEPADAAAEHTSAPTSG
jgi:redox-sensing transcriptional repressor